MSNLSDEAKRELNSMFGLKAVQKFTDDENESIKVNDVAVVALKLNDEDYILNEELMNGPY